MISPERAPGPPAARSSWSSWLGAAVRSGEAARPAGPPWVGRLSVVSLGLVLVPAAAAAGASGLPFLGARLGLGAPAGLGWAGGAHVCAGLVGAVLLLGKALRVGLGHRVRGVRRLARRQRWLSWSLLTLSGGAVATGVLLLLPVRGRLYGDLVELHLMTSAWALALAAGHVWQHRHRALSALGLGARRPGAGPARRWRPMLGLAVAAAPALLVVAHPRSVGPLPAAMAGATWARAGLAGVPLARLTVTPGGGALVAAGDGVFVSRDGGAWRSIGAPGGPGRANFRPGGHGGGHAGAAATAVQSLAASRDGVYVGTAEGLFFSAAPDGPLADLGLPGQDVAAIAVDPADPRVLWTASTAGVMLSADGGRTWSRQVSGLAQPERVSALACLAGRVLAGDPTGVYEWSPGRRSWARSSGQESVVSLVASPDGRQAYAASAGGELRQLSAAGWRTLASPDAGHRHDGGAHAGLAGVLPFAGRLFAAGVPGGVSASADGGQTWTQLGGGVGPDSPGQVAVFRGALWAATPAGAYRFLLAAIAPASPGWWAGLVAGSLAAGIGVLALAGFERPRAARRAGRRGRERERPFRGFEGYLASLGGSSAAPAPGGGERLRWPRPARPRGPAPPLRVALLAGCLVLAATLASAAALGGLAPWSAPGPRPGPGPAHATPPARPSHVLFADDFSKDPAGAALPAGWSAPDGGWDGVLAGTGHVVRHASGASYGHLVAGSPAWTDYTVSVSVRATALATGFAGVAGRYRGPGDYYLCDVHQASAVQLWRLSGGTGALLAGSPVAVDTSRPHTLRLTMTGARIVCALDGVAVVHEDGTFAGGAIALVASDGETAEFGDVIVTA